MTREHPVTTALRGYFWVLLSVVAFSCAINILTLTGSFYMLQVYDRVLPSRSIPTLVGLSVLILILYAIYGTLEFARSTIMSRIATRVDERLTPKVFDAIRSLPLLAKTAGDGMQPVRDLDQIRSFMSGSGLTALFDLPWIPIYIAFVYMLHPLLAAVAAGGALLLIVLTWLAEFKSAAPLSAAAKSGGQRLALAETVRRNADAIAAMGLAPNLAKRYVDLNRRYLSEQLKASDATSTIGNVTRVTRFLLQSAVLGLGGYLVVRDELTGGAIIAASITVSRALAPVELSIAHWRGFVAARQAAERLGLLFQAVRLAPLNQIDLPTPQSQLSAEQLFAAAPGERKPILRNIAFSLEKGDALGVIGPSESGKSTLARVLVGIWKSSGPESAVRLDGAALDQWPPTTLAKNIGYMPQDIELLSGTVAENIARFSEDASSEQVVSAATAAGAHELIVRLPQGYQTPIGEGGHTLSGGARQRIALARALFGSPFLVVLDEPNANLDAAGDTALTEAIRGIRRRGGIAVVIAHRPSALGAVNKILALANGRAQAFGPKDEVLRKVLHPVPAGGKSSEQPYFVTAQNPVKDGSC